MDQDVEVELYEENVGNLNYSTPNESRSSSPDRFLPLLSSQEPTQRRLEEIPFVAINPRPDPEELSHAPTSQVPRIHDSCHTTLTVSINCRQLFVNYHCSTVLQIKLFRMTTVSSFCSLMWLL